MVTRMQELHAGAGVGTNILECKLLSENAHCTAALQLDPDANATESMVKTRTVR